MLARSHRMPVTVQQPSRVRALRRWDFPFTLTSFVCWYLFALMDAFGENRNLHGESMSPWSPWLAWFITVLNGVRLSAMFWIVRIRLQRANAEEPQPANESPAEPQRLK